MPNDNLVLSEAGLEKLKKTEGVVDGLYDDSSGYCTFGVGHLVHQLEKWNCFLLEAASTDDRWKQYVLKQRPGKRKRYLTRPAVFADQISELKTNAIDIAKSAIALRKYKKAFDKLNKPEQEKSWRLPRTQWTSRQNCSRNRRFMCFKKMLSRLKGQ
jgi:lysozyme